MTKDNYKIYVHINKINGKMYIGQTCQTIQARWKDGRGYKESPYFWNAIQKYGWDTFEHIVLMENLSLEEANIFEEELIKKYNTTNRNFGYNVYYGGDNCKKPLSTKQKLSQYKYYGKDNPNYQHYWTDEMKQLLREKQRANPLYKNDNNPNAKQIICIETGEVFSCIKFANQYYNINDGLINAALKNPYRTANKLHWAYYDESLLDDTTRYKYMVNLILTYPKQCKNYIICKENKNIYNSKVDLSKELNVTVASITWSLNKHEIFVHNSLSYIQAVKHMEELNEQQN